MGCRAALPWRTGQALTPCCTNGSSPGQGETAAWRVLTPLPCPPGPQASRLQLCSPTHPQDGRWWKPGSAPAPDVTSSETSSPLRECLFPRGLCTGLMTPACPPRPGPRWMLTPCLPRESLDSWRPGPQPITLGSKAGCAAGAQQSPAGLDAFNWRGCWEGCVRRRTRAHTRAHMRTHTRTCTHTRTHAHVHVECYCMRTTTPCCNATHPS